MSLGATLGALFTIFLAFDAKSAHRTSPEPGEGNRLLAFLAFPQVARCEAQQCHLDGIEGLAIVIRKAKFGAVQRFRGGFIN